MKTHFHMKGDAPRLAFKKRYKATWKMLNFYTGAKSSNRRLNKNAFLNLTIFLKRGLFEV